MYGGLGILDSSIDRSAQKTMQAGQCDEAKSQHQPPRKAVTDGYNADSESYDPPEEGIGYLCRDMVHEVAARSKRGQDSRVRDRRTVICPHGTSEHASNTGIQDMHVFRIGYAV